MGNSKKKTAKKPVRMTTFKDRLKLLIGDDKPYAWCKKVGIEKGLFQYYWQKGKIPKVTNLLKIRKFSGCSLDWILTGEGEVYPDRVADMEQAANAVLSQANGHVAKLEKMITRLKKIKAGAKSLKSGKN